ncbi:MAG: zinc finger Ran-binding domain-containing family 2 protein [Clostridia bacterium]|nr:zinc finger Ran-binding domain-containing family 2 protein [Clostridia bacterium]
MKCPHCGHWNRASLPRCFKCGAALTPPAPQPPVQNIQEQPPVPDVAVQTPAPAQKAAAPVSEKKAAKAPSGKTYIRYNEEGYATASVDDRDALARDMQSLQERKQKGLLVQQQLRQNSAQQGIAPTGRHVQSMTGRVDYPPFYKNLVIREEDEVEGDVRQDAIAVVSNRSSAQAEQETLDFTHLPSYSAPSVLRSRKNARSFGMGRYLRLFACLLLVIVLIGGGIWFISQHSDKDQKTLQDLVVIDNTIYNDVAAHRIKIPADEGAVIYIKELHRSYTVTGGYAIVEVEDYKWYEDLELAVEDAVGEEKEAAQKKLDELMQQESITATITPYIKSAGNVQKPMGQIQFNVEIPLSPLIVITPDTLMDETSTKQYTIEFEVEKNSKVTINGEDLSYLVDTRDGLLNYQAPVQPIGNNYFTITTRAQHCRPTTTVVTLYRAPQVIPLDLQADISPRYSPRLVEDKSKEPDAKGKYPMMEEPMVVRCSTITSAKIEILSDYRNLDLSRLTVDGTFSFEPVFRKIGTNTITIIASDPNDPSIPPSVVKHDVYYVPIATVYTPKAWDMCRDYTDFLNNSATRIANSQIYVCKGTITEILSEKPQLAIMTLDDNPSRTVLLENLSNDKYEVGKRYRVYGDAYGLYNGMPRLIGRYTYPPLD